MDLFAEALCKLLERGRATLRIERDDGYEDTEDLSWYLTSYPSFPRFEKAALRFARGRVLDLGCGAGRHALYLQRRGLSVVGVDASPRLVDLARRRGVRDVRVADACRPLPFRDREFDTVILFGNNLGICGTPAKFRLMLRELHRVTVPRGRILATTRMPGMVDAADCAYLYWNIARGRAPGQVRLCVRFEGRQSEWFDLLLFSPTDLMQMAAKEGWRVTQVFTERDMQEGYSVVMEKI